MVSFNSRVVARLVCLSLVAAGLSTVSTPSAEAYTHPTVTIVDGPAVVAVGEPATFTIEVVDPNNPAPPLNFPPAANKVFLCFASAPLCGYTPDLLSVGTGAVTGEHTARYSLTTSGPIDEGGQTIGPFEPGVHEMVAWYEYSNPDDPTLQEYEPSVPREFQVAIPSAPTITSGPPPGGTVGQPYHFTVEATGYPTPTLTVSGLPSGLSFDPTGRAINGTPDAAGVFTVSGIASNGVAPDAQAIYEVTIASAGVAPTITTPSLPQGSQGQAYAFTLSATGNPAPTWTVAGLPGGLTANSTSGRISGVPTSAGNFSVQVTASNGVAPDATATYALVVAAPPIQALTLSPDRVDFGDQRVGTTSPVHTVQVTNTGSVAVRFDQISVSAPFAWASNSGSCMPLDRLGGLQPGMRCTLRLIFSPTVTGPVSRTVTVTGSSTGVGTGVWRLPLTGTGTAPGTTFPILTFDPATVSFGVQRLGGSAVQRVTLRNIGTAPAQITNRSIAAPFALASNRPDSCAGLITSSRTLDPQASCTFTVAFRPTRNGPVSGTLIVTASGGNVVGGTWQLQLAGVGAGPVVAFTPTSLDFGSVRGSQVLTVTLTNIGATDLLFNRPTTTGPFALPSSPVPPTACSRITSALLRPGASCTVLVQFNPPRPRGVHYSGTVTVTARNSTDTWILALTGTGA